MSRASFANYSIAPSSHSFSNPSAVASPTSQALHLRHILSRSWSGSFMKVNAKVEDIVMNSLCLTRLGPLTAKPSSDGKVSYQFELMVTEGENLMLEPTAGTLLFSPPRGSLVGANDCVNMAVELHAEKGRLIEGSVIPPSAGIKISVTRGTTDEVVVITETAEDGKFKIGPLQGSVDYR